MNPLNYPSAGLGNVGSYQIAGHVFLTGSNITGSGPNSGEVKISFPQVPRHITVTNIGTTPLYVHFDSRANINVVDNMHYSILSAEGAAWAYNVKVRDIYISCQNATDNGTFSLMAELTSIEMPALFLQSGSGIND